MNLAPPSLDPGPAPVVAEPFLSLGDGRTHLVAHGITRIGRAEDCELRLQEANVSRLHCELHREGETVRIFDRSATNPTRLDGRAVLEGQALQPGNILQVGCCKLVFGTPDSYPAATPAGDSQDVVAQTDRIAHDSSATRPGAPIATRRSRRIGAKLAALALAAAVLGAVGFEALAGSAVPATNRPALAASPDAVRSEVVERLLPCKDHAASLEGLRRAVAAVDSLRREVRGLRAAILDLAARSRTTTVRDPVQMAATRPAVAPREARRPPAPAAARSQPRRAADAAAASTDRLERSLIAAIEEFGTPHAGVSSLEPHLTQLCRIPGQRSAAALLGAQGHCSRLLSELDFTMDGLRLRRRHLLGQARQRGSLDSDSRELGQRLVELLDTKLAILSGQRRRLLSFETTLRQSLAARGLPIPEPTPPSRRKTQ